MRLSALILHTCTAFLLFWGSGRRVRRWRRRSLALVFSSRRDFIGWNGVGRDRVNVAVVFCRGCSSFASSF